MVDEDWDMTRTESLEALDLAQVTSSYADNFELIQALDPQGTVLDEQAVAAVEPEVLVGIMKDLVWAHTFDERIINLNRQGALGNYAPAGGQEASQFATLAALEDGDFMAPTYRDLAPLIRHGLPMHQAFLWWRGHMAGNLFPEDLQAWVPQVIVGGSIPHVAGVALGKKLKGDDHVVMAYCGDGATSQGDFYEGLNFAGVYKAPLIVVVQNNGYAISVPFSKQTAAQTIAQKGVAAGIPALRVDGNDPVALYLATRKAREFALGGGGAVLIEAVTYRTGAHTMSDDPTRYRTEDEVNSWADKSALTRLRNHLQSKDLWNQEMEDEVVEQVKAEVKAALAQMGKTPPQKVSDFLRCMYEVAPQNIAEQISEYEKKEAR